jgi:hypothetical protein
MARSPSLVSGSRRHLGRASASTCHLGKSPSYVYFESIDYTMKQGPFSDRKEESAGMMSVVGLRRTAGEPLKVARPVHRYSY